MLGLGAQLPPQCFLHTLAVLLGPVNVRKLSRHIFSILLATHKACACLPHEDPMVTGTWLKVVRLHHHLSRPMASTSSHQVHHQEEIIQKQKTRCQIVSMPGKENSSPPFHWVNPKEILFGGLFIRFREALILVPGLPVFATGMDLKGCHLNTGHRLVLICLVVQLIESIIAMTLNSTICMSGVMICYDVCCLLLFDRHQDFVD